MYTSVIMFFVLLLFYSDILLLYSIRVQESMSHHAEDVERLQEDFAEERSRLLHQIAQLQHYAPSILLFRSFSSSSPLLFSYILVVGMHIVGETEHQVVNAIDMEMRARRAEREAQVARDEAWKERIIIFIF